MNITRRYYDIFSRSFYDPYKNGSPVFNISLPRFDWVRFRVAVTYGKQVVNKTTGIPTAGQVDLQAQVSSIFSLKDNFNYYAKTGSTFQFTNGGGYDTSDTGWHAPSTGCVTLAPIVIPSTVWCGEYFAAIKFFTATGVTWELIPDGNTIDAAPRCLVQRDAYTGLESSVPSGIPGGLHGTWTISGTSQTVNITIPNCTANCQLAIGVQPATGGAGDVGTITQQVFVNPLNPALSYVQLATGSAPGAGAAYNGTYTLLGL